jgi:hypothetical protein
MTRIVDDDPPIKTHPASKEYRDGWERMFGEKCPESVTEFETDPEGGVTEVTQLNCKHCGRPLDKYGYCPDL